MFDILVDDHTVCICVPGCVKAFVATLTNSLGEEYKIQVRKHIDPEDSGEPTESEIDEPVETSETEEIKE